MIPGFLITWLTFPGVIVHEFAHKVFCQWTGTRVVEVCYFRFGNPAGFVIHEIPSSVWRHILIGIGPLFINTALGLLLGLLAAMITALHGVPLSTPVGVTVAVVLYLAVSIAMHSFPSTGDARAIWRAVWGRGAPVTAKLAGTPLVGLIYLGALGSMVWLDLLYGVGIAVGIPHLLQLN